MMVKVCGITNPDDALAAADAGASAIGFNFYPRSPRFVTPGQAARMAALLPRNVLKVGVFVNEEPGRIAQIVDQAGLDVAQLHGDETASGYPAGVRVWKAVRVAPGFDPAMLAGHAAEALLLDGPAGLLYGGAGRTFDWSLAAGIHARIILAGGLGPDNVRHAIETARPWGVDACSAIESAPGRKDHAKMTAFIQAALAVHA